MKKRIPVLVLLVFAIGLINLEVFGTGVKYDPQGALTYAEIHCSASTYNTEKYECFNKSNPSCKSTGTDCANFMSQALIDGGITFSDCINSNYSVKGEDPKCDKKQLIKGNNVIGKDGSTKGVTVASDLAIVQR